MGQDPFNTVLEQRDRWLTEQIGELSVTLLSQGIFTCTECGKVSGQYIIQQGDESHRLPAVETYAMLQFLLAQSQSA